MIFKCLEYGANASTTAYAIVADVRGRLHLPVSAVHDARLSGMELKFVCVSPRERIPYCVCFLKKVAPTAATPAAPGSSNNAALTATQFAKAPTGYNSTGYASQYDSLGSNQGTVSDYSGKGNSGNTYSNTQPPNKASGNSANVSGQNANSGNTDLSMYGKSHTSLTKVC